VLDYQEGISSMAFVKPRLQRTFLININDAFIIFIFTVLITTHIETNNFKMSGILLVLEKVAEISQSFTMQFEFDSF
jgi:hypothetical protein